MEGLLGIGLVEKHGREYWVVVVVMLNEWVSLDGTEG